MLVTELRNWSMELVSFLRLSVGRHGEVRRQNGERPAQLLVRLTLINGTPDWAHSSVRPVGRRLARARRPGARQTARITGTGIAGSTRGTARPHADTVAASFGTGTNLRRAERRPVGPDRCFIAGGVVAVVIVVVSGVMYR